MKPVLLKMEAFGPYAGLQEIDFTLLKDANMFLIHGSTGGGKTTILDAICYALYGETSGKERDPDSMRSHFAKEDHLTQVEFTFKVGQETYFVHRIPGQKRPKKVGSGFTDQKPDGWLYKYGEGDPELLASGVTGVKEKIIEVIGFDADQFRQVIIIPQGQFRKLLVAKSEERQQILGEIFQTRKYRRVEDKIRDEERTLKNDVAAIKERRKEQIKNIKYRPDTLLESLMEKENIDTDQVISQVEDLCQTQEEEIQKLAQEITQSDDKLKIMSKEITLAINNNKKHIEKVDVEKQYNELISKEALYKAKEKEYSLAQKALPFKTKEQYIADLAQQKDKVSKELIGEREKIKALEKDFIEASSKVEACKKQEPERQKLELALNKALEEYRPKSIDLISLEKEMGLIKKAIQQAKTRQETLKTQIETIDKEVLQGEEALEQRQSLNDAFRKQALESERLNGVLKQKTQLEETIKTHKNLQEQYREISLKLRETGENYAKANELHNTLLQQWIQGQAGELAKNLKENQACPVCGSTSHPQPAISGTETTTKQELEAKKLGLDKALKVYQDTQAQQAGVKERGQASKEQVESQEEALGNYAQSSLEDIQGAYNKGKGLEKEINEKLQALTKLQEKITKQKSDKSKMDEEMTLLQEEDRENADKFMALKTQIDQIKKDIPEDLRIKKALDNYIKGLEKTIKEHKETHEKASKDLEEVSAAKIKSETTEKEKIAQLKEIKARHEKESADFKIQREKAGFETFDYYKEAYRSQETLNKLDQDIKAYRNLYSAIKDRFKRLKEETKEIVLVDVEALEKNYQELEKDKEKLSRDQQTISLEKEHNENQMAIILKSSQKIASKEKRYAIVGNLYDAVRGKNTKGLSFERFIQSSLFEDVLIRANERLTLMSNNRYELYRSDNRESLAAQSGLDLEVLDTYTGKKRHVRTLSGGEGFMASLSLALGLADVVQSYAGGISLDTIFIDEGFGTLDTESLDAAIKTLIDLQKSGRLVGIISHVPELKERIGARLEVVTTQNGSRAEFHL